MIPQKIFNYFAEEHNLLLTETEYADMISLIEAEQIAELKELLKLAARVLAKYSSEESVNAWYKIKQALK